jgi:hypothetical protein
MGYYNKLLTTRPIRCKNASMSVSTVFGLDWEVDCPDTDAVHDAGSLPWNDWAIPMTFRNASEGQITEAWTAYWLEILRGLVATTYSRPSKMPWLETALAEAQNIQLSMFSTIPPHVVASLTKVPELSSFFRKGGFDISTCSPIACPGAGGPGSPPPEPMPVSHTTGMLPSCRETEKLRHNNSVSLDHR